MRGSDGKKEEKIHTPGFYQRIKRETSSAQGLVGHEIG